jgi:hypothetical protein
VAVSAKRARYKLERVQGSSELGQLQDRLGGLFEKLSKDTEDGVSSASSAATAGGTSYTPADALVWAGTAPTTAQEAYDRLAYHIKTGAGAVPIVELP